MSIARFRLAIVVTLLVALSFVSLVGPYQGAYAATSSDFATANAAIQNAYVVVYELEVQSHGNVGNLVNQLNVATQFVNKAYLENSTLPANATNDLVSAETIAQQVVNEAKPISKTAVQVHELQTFESIGLALAVIASSSLIYITSDFVHRWWWVRAFRNYTVRLRTIHGESE